MRAERAGAGPVTPRRPQGVAPATRWPLTLPPCQNGPGHREEGRGGTLWYRWGVLRCSEAGIWTFRMPWRLDLCELGGSGPKPAPQDDFQTQVEGTIKDGGGGSQLPREDRVTSRVSLAGSLPRPEVGGGGRSADCSLELGWACSSIRMGGHLTPGAHDLCSRPRVTDMPLSTPTCVSGLTPTCVWRVPGITPTCAWDGLGSDGGTEARGGEGGRWSLPSPRLSDASWLSSGLYARGPAPSCSRPLPSGPCCSPCGFSLPSPVPSLPGSQPLA